MRWLFDEDGNFKEGAKFGHLSLDNSSLHEDCKELHVGSIKLNYDRQPGQVAKFVMVLSRFAKVVGWIADQGTHNNQPMKTHAEVEQQIDVFLSHSVSLFLCLSQSISKLI